MNAQECDLTDRMDAYLDRQKVRGLSVHTLTSYRISLESLVGSLGDISGDTDVTDITREQIDAWIAGLVEAGRKPSAVKTRLQGVRRFFRDAIAEGYCESDPTDRVKAPTVRPPVIEFPDDGQIDHLLRTTRKDKTFAGRRDYALLRLLAETGARRAEIANLALDPKSVDFNIGATGEGPSGYVDTATKTVHIRNGKGGGNREVGFTPETAIAVRSYLRARESQRGRARCSWLWLSRSMNRGASDSGRLLPTGVNEVFERRCRRAEVRKADGTLFTSPHALRHAWASRMLRAGLNLLDVKALGGWSSLEMLSKRYGQYQANERAMDAARKLPPTF